MTLLSDEAAAELQRLCEAATPAPAGWTGFRTGILAIATWVVSNDPNQDGHIMRQQDADFIAAARTALPALLADRLARKEREDIAVRALLEVGYPHCDYCIPIGEPPHDKACVVDEALTAMGLDTEKKRWAKLREMSAEALLKSTGEGRSGG